MRPVNRELFAALCAQAIARHGEDILLAHGMQIERSINQHGVTSIFAHSLGVAYLSLYWARRLRLQVDERALVRGALLHDYFLYDWHERGHGLLHGVRHPQIALDNARREFSLGAVEEDVIARHMFPLGIRPPHYTESWLVCMADKVCAVLETFRLQTGCAAMIGELERRTFAKPRSTG